MITNCDSQFTRPDRLPLSPNKIRQNQIKLNPRQSTQQPIPPPKPSRFLPNQKSLKLPKSNSTHLNPCPSIPTTHHKFNLTNKTINLFFYLSHLTLQLLKLLVLLHNQSFIKLNPVPGGPHQSLHMLIRSKQLRD